MSALHRSPRSRPAKPGALTFGPEADVQTGVVDPFVVHAGELVNTLARTDARCTHPDVLPSRLPLQPLVRCSR